MSAEYNQYRQLLWEKRYLEASKFAEFQYQQGNSNNPFWLTRQAAALCRAGNHAQALKTANQALSLQPNNPYSILAAAEALFGLSRIEEALSHFEAIGENPKLTGFARKGILNCLAAKKDWNQILHLLAHWEMPPDSAFDWKVRSLTGLNRLEEAVSVCRDRLKTDPDDPRGLWALTELEIQKEGMPPVLARMAKLAKIPSRPSIYKEIHASLCRRSGKPDAAIEQYAKITRKESNPKIHRKQAFAMAKSGRELEAIPLMEELLKIDPVDYYLHRSYIPACQRAGALDRARIFYEQLIAANPGEKSLFGWIRKIKGLIQKEESNAKAGGTEEAAGNDR